MITENYLEKVNNYKNKTESYFRRLEDAILDFDIKYDHDDYFIEPNKNWYNGIISVNTTASISEWFQKYHKPFTDSLNLKLIRVSKKETIGSKYIKYKLEHTYKNNPRFEELTLDKIKWRSEKE